VALHGKRAVMAGEPWKIINLDWGPWVDGCYSACLLVEMLAEHGGTVTELFSDIPNYPQRRLYLDCPDELKELVMLHAEKRLSKEKTVSSIWTFDGIRVNYEDASWLLIRASGTQQRICVHVEGRTRRLYELWSKGTRLVKGAIRTNQK
jgi:phosphomannomutase